MIELNIVIDEVEYEALSALLTPVIERQMAEGKIPAWAKLLFLGRGVNKESVAGFLRKLPAGVKDKMAAGQVNANREKAGGVIEKFALDNGIKLKVKSVTAKAV